ncbi:MAG: uracil-DNA glycosylase [Terracidiphilus sp.]
MPRALDPATREALAERLRFYRDLGLTDFYRRPVDEAAWEGKAVIEEVGAPGLDSETRERNNAVPENHLAASTTAAQTTVQQSGIFGEESAIKSRKSFHAPEIGAQVPAGDRASALQMIRDEIGDCTRCALHKGRNKLVFADGSPVARLMFVGEGPGADEDAQGLPFVGRAGQLLNNMITAMGLKREECYIANVVKCRPPGNRTPEPEEANTCSPFLFRQIDVVHPQVLVALGATAATYLLGARQPLAGLRGRVHAFRGMSLIVTYHPAFLLRDPRQKKEAWADLQIAMKELGLKKAETKD